jgi:hypothetical protein
MIWTLHRWVWRLQSPVYIGMPPASSINRTRLYVPARVLWGALTAELARHERSADKDPDYKGVGAWLFERCRFTYLFAAEHLRGAWRAWLPTYREGEGLVWVSEADRSGSHRLSDRALRRRLLSTRPGTSIDPGTDAAEDGSLRETESVQTRWRDARGQDAGPVALVGYVFLHQPDHGDAQGVQRIEPIKTLFIGGDTRYGQGHIEREELAEAREIFASRVALDRNEPRIRSQRALAHAVAGQDADLRGDLELLGGWDRGTPLALEQASVRWRPGTMSHKEPAPTWIVDRHGFWREPASSESRQAHGQERQER